MKKRIIPLSIIFFVLAAGLLTSCEDADEATQINTISKEEAADEGEINTESTEAAESQEETGEDEAGEDEAGSNSDEAGEAELIGFTVYDNSQNEKKLSEYVDGNKVTMLNFWATFCGPCIGEMPYLAEIEKEYKDKGFEIVGVSTDVTDYDKGGLIPELLKEADDIVAQTGVEYPICHAKPDLIQYTEITAVPTTFFVDGKGNLLAEPMVGSRSREDWESIINDLLEGADGK